MEDTLGLLPHQCSGAAGKRDVGLRAETLAFSSSVSLSFEMAMTCKTASSEGEGRPGVLSTHTRLVSAAHDPKHI